jgi:Fe-S oxidoreductase
MVVVGFDDVYHAGDYVPEVLEFEPLGLEGMDQELIADNRRKQMNLDRLKLLPRGDGLLLVEFGADDRQEAIERSHRFQQAIRGRPHVVDTRVFEDPDEQLQVWEVRESGLGATARVPQFADTWPGWEDSAVAPQHLGDYMRKLRKLMGEFGYRGDFYGHFGQGCLHTRISFDLQTRQGVNHYRQFIERAADLALEFGGSFSGEHGDGQARAELLPKMFGPEICQAFREFKQIWDPEGKMNPGKVVDPYPLTSNLRLGPHIHPADPPTWFGYAEDQGRFSRATLRCVGVGACRREDAGIMCPSYMVTRQEKHSTRGRARLLLEMLQGEVITEGWRSEEVKDALDLCLACKGCKGECPVNVDMATYKAEFLSHYYRGRIRPAAAYSMGLIYWWARLASRVPRLANTVMTAPLLSSLLKRAGGIAAQRELPLFAVEPFRARFARRPRRNPEGPPVIFWPDTFNNFFHPETAEAAVDVLEAAGRRVLVPPRLLCCGRPLYDFGMLHLARRQLRQVLHELRPALEARVPIVGIEPSCVAVFRDELVNILPGHAQARQLRDQVFTLDEFLQSHTDLEIPPLRRKAVVHGHCHHRSVLNFDSELALLRQAGLEVQPLDSGCCGMAGSFGFEQDKFPVSMACGERVLLPEVRQADGATLIVADGFSCRQQIRQGTGRQAMHSAQILQMALADPQPSSAACHHQPEPRRTWTAGQIGAVSAALLLGGLAAWTWMRQKP